MRAKFPEKLENGRIRSGYLASARGKGYGAFQLIGPNGAYLGIVASDGKDGISGGWEHVSVSLHNRTPNWTELSFVKDLFWNEEETVIQLHPPRSQWINNHPHTLHLWKPPFNVPLPPSILIGDKDSGVIESSKDAMALLYKLTEKL